MFFLTAVISFLLPIDKKFVQSRSRFHLVSLYIQLVNLVLYMYYYVHVTTPLILTQKKALKPKSKYFKVFNPQAILL